MSLSSARLPVANKVHVDPFKKGIDALGQDLSIQAFVINLRGDDSAWVVERSGGTFQLHIYLAMIEA